MAGTATRATPSPPHYRAFYIWITGPADAPVAAVDGAPGGSLPQTPLDRGDWAGVQALLAQVRAGTRDLGTVAALGRGLFTLLFTPPLRDLYQQSLGRLGPGERLRLLLRCDVADLAALPWELLCDPTSAVPGGAFLALDAGVSIARFLPEPTHPAPPPRSGPLRVLAVFSSPTDQPALDLAREVRLIRQALGGLPPERVQVDMLMRDAVAQAAGPGAAPLGPPSPAALLDALAAGYEVLHFAGHGALPAGGPGVLALEDAAGRTALLDSGALRIALQGTPTRLAVLSACNTAGGSAAPDVGPGLRDILGSPPPALPAATGPAVAPALVDAGLPAVVAMQFVIPDAAALSFGRTLYSALARNAPIDAALMETRKALRVDPASPQADWATPILYLQDVGDGLLWQPADAASPAAPGGDAAADTAGPARARHGGIEFRGPTTIHGPVAGGDIGNITMGDIYAAPPGAGPAAPANAAAALQPAFAALVGAIDDDALLAQARALRQELLAAEPSWARLSEIRLALSTAPGLAAATAAFFADPAVRAIVQAAKLRFAEA